LSKWRRKMYGIGVYVNFPEKLINNDIKKYRQKELFLATELKERFEFALGSVIGEPGDYLVYFRETKKWKLVKKDLFDDKFKLYKAKKKEKKP
jgi:hypothetical protein